MTALYSLYDALVSINVPSDKARAVVDAMEREMTAILATKTDIDQLDLALKADINQLETTLKADMNQLELTLKTDIKLLDQKMDGVRTDLHHEIESLRSWMIIRLGSMQIAGIALLFTGLKLTS